MVGRAGEDCDAVGGTDLDDLERAVLRHIIIKGGGRAAGDDDFSRGAIGDVAAHVARAEADQQRAVVGQPVLKAERRAATGDQSGADSVRQRANELQRTANRFDLAVVGVATAVNHK